MSSIAKKDPFDDSREELEKTLKQLASLSTAMRSAAPIDFSVGSTQSLGIGHFGHQVDPEAEFRRFVNQIKRFEQLLDEAQEDYHLLADVVSALKEKRGGVRGQSYNPAIVNERERFIGETEDTLQKHEIFLKRMKASREDLEMQREERRARLDGERRAAVAAAGGTTAVRIEDDPLVQDSQLEQQQLREEEARVLESLTHGMGALRQKATIIDEEVDEQEDLIDAIDTDVTTIQGKISVMTKKVNHILDNMSDRGKTCLILLLCFILGMLIAVLVTS